MSTSTKTKIPRGRLQFDPRTNEPYLSFSSSQHPTLRITSVRVDDHDMAAMTLGMNDPDVVRNLSSPPYPYFLEHAKGFLTSLKEEYDALEIVEGEDAPRYATVSPVRALREVQADGSDVYVGDIDIPRWNFLEISSEEERKRAMEENEKKEAGDPTIIWSFGDFLIPSHRGRGIMSAAIHTIIHEWAIPVLNAKHIKAAAYKDNIASQRTFIKNGFKLVEEVVAKGDMTHKGRSLEDMALCIFEWRAEEQV